MDVVRFERSPVGRVVPVSWDDTRTGRRHEHFAFVPDKLPAEVTLTQGTHKRLGEAARLLGAVEGRVQQLPNPRLLIGPALAREAVATSALEGTYAPLADVLEAEYLDDGRRSAEVREIQNYVQAAMAGVELIAEKPLCTTLLQRLQAMIVRGTRGDGYDAGKLRQRLVAIGNPGDAIETARFVPPPHTEVPRAMSDWEKWINADDEMPLLVKVALGHYQFETIHPFSDGNGRLGRLVMTLQLIANGALTYPVLNLSPWIEPRRTLYMEHLLNSTVTGSFDPWVRFFADAVAAQAEAAARTIDELLEIRADVLQMLRDHRATGMVLDLASDLIGYPRISVSKAAGLYRVSYPAANAAIQRLVKLGVMREITGGSYGRVFACDRVYEVIARA